MKEIIIYNAVIISIFIPVIITSIYFKIKAANTQPFTLSESIIKSDAFQSQFFSDSPFAANYFQTINWKINFDHFKTNLTSIEITFPQNVRVDNVDLQNEFLRSIQRKFLNSYYKYSQDLWKNPDNLNINVKEKLETFVNQYQKTLENGKHFIILLIITITSFVLLVLSITLGNVFCFTNTKELQPKLKLDNHNCLLSFFKCFSNS